MSESKHTPGPWEYIPSNQNHGPYVISNFGGDICDCYTMSNLSDRAVCNGGSSRPIHFQHEQADANARLIAATPDLRAAADEIDRWALVIESAVRAATGPSSRDYKAIVVALKANSAAIAKATGGQS